MTYHFRQVCCEKFMPFSAERLKEIRQRKRITQRELADLCGISDVQLSRYENEKMDPSLTNLEAIAQNLQVSIDYLMKLSDDPNKNYGTDALDMNEQEVLETYRREGWHGVAKLSVEKLSNP